MSFCSRCGSQLTEGAAFCQSCGQKIASASTAQPTQNTSEQPNYSYIPYSADIAPATPAIGVIKKIASSPLFLTAAIAFTLVMVFEFISAFTFGRLFEAAVGYFFRFADLTESYELQHALYDLEYYLSDIINILTSVSVSVMFVGMIPSILVSVGLWRTFAAGADRKTGGFSTAGLTMIKVITVISFVFTCIGYSAALILMLIFTIGVIGYSYSVPVGAFIIFFFALSVLVAAAVLTVLWFVKILKMINAVKTTARAGNADPYASKYVGVWCFLTAFGNFFSLVTAFGIAAKMSALCSAVAFCCFGILIFTYRSRMKALAYTPMPLSSDFKESDSSN